MAQLNAVFATGIFSLIQPPPSLKSLPAVSDLSAGHSAPVFQPMTVPLSFEAAAAVVAAAFVAVAALAALAA